MHAGLPFLFKKQTSNKKIEVFQRAATARICFRKDAQVFLRVISFFFSPHFLSRTLPRVGRSSRAHTRIFKSNLAYKYKYQRVWPDSSSFFPPILQERSPSSVSSRAATGGLQTAATERSTCTFTRQTSPICAKCVTSPTHIPAPYGNTWR